MVTFGSCNDCHTPWKFNPEKRAPEPDMTRMLSGHPVPDSLQAGIAKGNDGLAAQMKQVREAREVKAASLASR